MTQYKTLTWRQIENLDKTGFYHLPFYSDDHDVEVVYVTPNNPNVRMKVIIVKMDDGSFQDFYYNDVNEVFKPLTISYEAEDDFDEVLVSFGDEWNNSHVGIECPKEYAHCVGHFEDIFEF